MEMVTETLTTTNRQSQQSQNQVEISKTRVIELFYSTDSIATAKELVQKEYNLTIANTNKLFKDLGLSKSKNQTLIIGE